MCLRALWPGKKQSGWQIAICHPDWRLWAQLGLNQRPPDYESGATNQLSYRPFLALLTVQDLRMCLQKYIFTS